MLPTPDRTAPNTDSLGPVGPSGADYADKVAAEIQALWNGTINALTSVSGSANAITAACIVPLATSYQHGQYFWLVPVADNTGAVTINIDGRGVVNLRDYAGAALVAGDLVTGRGIAIIAYASGSPLTVSEMRLTGPTPRALLASASAASAVWEQVGDSGALGTVAQVEVTWTAGRYSKVIVIADDVGRGGSGNTSLEISLRNSTTAIVTNQGNIASTTNTETMTYIAEYTVSLGSHHRCLGIMYGNMQNDADVGDLQVGSNATSPDRVRVNSSAQNIVGGRVVVYGLLTDP